MHLGDGCRGQWRAFEGGEQFVDPSAELGLDHLVDLRPRDWGHIVLEPTQFLDELIGQQVTAGGEHLPEFDEGDAAIVEGKADRAGQTSAAVRGAEFGPPAASQIGEKAPALEDSHDLRVAFRPTKALA
jgi:hypothetical protein